LFFEVEVLPRLRAVRNRLLGFPPQDAHHASGGESVS
jgi:hypothetical protein